MKTVNGTVEYDGKVVEIPRFLGWLTEMVQLQNGAMVSFHIVKKNGEERVLVGKLGVTKHLKGGESTTAHLPYLLTVFDMNKKAYRNVDLNRVKALKIDGITYRPVP